jgi:DNA-binding NarL/FixJ family response regulator
VRVLIVDDDRRFAEALTALLEADAMSVVGHAANGVEGVAAAEELRPDVVTMDLVMPQMDGIEATRRIAQLGIPVVVLTGSRTRGGDAIKAGAAAFVLKSDAPVLLTRVLRTVVEAA